MEKPTGKTKKSAYRLCLAGKKELRKSFVTKKARLVYFTGCLFMALAVISLKPKSIFEKIPVSPPLLIPEKDPVDWEEILNRYPDYPDAYLRASLSSLEKSETAKAFRYLQLAEQLAPHHPLLKKVENEVYRRLDQGL